MTPNSDDKKPSASPALRNVHIILVGTAIAFAFGFAVYLLLVTRARLPDGDPTWPIYVGVGLSGLAGVGMIVYLRSFLRHTSL
jgi:hypothetical protein